MGDYSSGDEASLPGTSANLDHVYDATDLSNVQTNDTNYVEQTGSAGYELHQYKDSITATSANVTWIGKSSLAPSSSKVQLQVYKVAAPAGWQDVSGAGASNNVAAADTDFTLSGTIATADYLDSGVITYRVYQAASAEAHLIASYALSNRDDYQNLPDGDPVNASRCGQSFVGDGSNLSNVKFYLAKGDLPVGDMTAQLWSYDAVGEEHNPVAALTTSTNSINASTLDASFAEKTFTFDETYTLILGTNYYIMLLFPSNSGTGSVQFAIDTSSPSPPEPGYFTRYYDGGWHTLAHDVWCGCFEVYGI